MPVYLVPKFPGTHSHGLGETNQVKQRVAMDFRPGPVNYDEATPPILPLNSVVLLPDEDVAFPQVSMHEYVLRCPRTSIKAVSGERGSGLQAAVDRPLQRDVSQRLGEAAVDCRRLDVTYRAIGCTP
jgi:hypothetical protein